MVAPFATPTDVVTLWRPSNPVLSDPETTYVTVLLTQASALIRRGVSGIDDAIASGDVDADLVSMVAANAVLRVLRNPSGASQQSIGPESASFAGVKAAGQVVITAEELALLSPLSDGTTVGGSVVGSFRLARPRLHEACADPLWSAPRVI